MASDLVNEANVPKTGYGAGAIPGRERTISREDFLASRPHAWRVWAWASDLRFDSFALCVSRVVGDEVKESDYPTLEAASAFARERELERIDAFLSEARERMRPRSLLRRAIRWFRKTASPRQRERNTRLLKRVESAEEQRRGIESGKAGVPVKDIPETIRVAGYLPVGTTLWLLRLASTGREPLILRARVESVEEEIRNEGSSLLLAFSHDIRVIGYDGVAGKADATFDEDFELAGDAIPDELPWIYDGERLFTSREAAVGVARELSEKYRRLADELASAT